MLRSMSTRIPRPKNWRTSPFDSPLPLMSSPPSHSPSHSPYPRRPRPSGGSQATPAQYARHRLALRKAFPEGWSPPRKLSRDAMDGLRMLHNHSPETFTTPVLAERFKISPEAVRRILRSKWAPDKERKIELRIRDEQRKMENRRSRAQDEWEQGVKAGALKIKKRPDEDRLEIT